ncbi:MAG: ABC transporter permease [Chitinivibrionales bacterium]|nr:ABC transporter permease [Chitinivibrionales bacterium]
MNLTRLREIVAVNGKLCLIEMSSNKARSFLTSLGIFMGVSALLANIAFLRAMDSDLKKEMEQMGGLNLITIAGRGPKSKQENILFSRSPGLTLTDAEQVKTALPFVAALLPQRDMGRPVVHAQGKQTNCRGLAVGQLHMQVYDYKLDAGRALSRDDFNEHALVCVIGKRIMNRLFGKDAAAADVLGRKVTLGRFSFVIVGVIATENPWDWRAREMLVPFPVYEERFAGTSNKLSSLTLMIKTGAAMDRAKKELRLKMLVLHRGIEDFEISANDDKIADMKKAGLGMNILLMAIALISLLMGGISIMNIMFATIGDRIREIGIRKALGAHKADIFIQFIIETVVLCSVGALPGLVAGSVVIMLPKGVFPFQPILTFGDYGIAILFTILVGIISGTFPAFRAANMEPAEALRY